jgi:hypothetical protein
MEDCQAAEKPARRTIGDCKPHTMIILHDWAYQQPAVEYYINRLFTSPFPCYSIDIPIGGLRMRTKTKLTSPHKTNNAVLGFEEKLWAATLTWLISQMGMIIDG